MMPSSRKEALSLNEKYYLTNAPCMKGHLAKRYALNSTCVECSALSQKSVYAKYPGLKSRHDRSYRASHSEAIKAGKSAYAKRNKDRLRIASKKWVAENKDKVRSYQRAYSRRLLPAPTRPCPATCECCGAPPTVTALHLDHCHETGAFRGWLCMKCNTAIAKLGDNIDGISRALAYLKLATTAPP